MNGGKNISDCSNVIIISLRVKRTNSFVWLSSGSATTSFIYYSRRYLTGGIEKEKEVTQGLPMIPPSRCGYIPILMLILSVKASQVLVVPKNVGFSIPRYEPEPEP